MDDQRMDTAFEKLWVVSPPRLARFAFDHPGLKTASTAAREYRISSIGHYLISPTALSVRRRLVGCEIHWHLSPLSRWLHPSRKFWSKKASRHKPPLSLILDFPNSGAASADINLRHHIDRLYDGLRLFDSFHQSLEQISLKQTARVDGICEDDAGFQTPITIEGNPSQQLDFIRRHVGRQIDVRLRRAHIADGLFEMKGFDFTRYDARTQHRLIRFVYDGVPKACVLNEDHTIAFWLDDVKLVNYLQLFEYCIQHNHHMRESLIQCIQGKAAALRLMFNPRLEIDYSQAPLPAVIQEAIGQTRLAGHSDRLIKQNLNLYQVGVSFNAMALQESGGSELCTHISILQNLRALEPIKDRLPSLFEEMAKRAAQSEEGKFYLLESIRGARHDS